MRKNLHQLSVTLFEDMIVMLTYILCLYHSDCPKELYLADMPQEDVFTIHLSLITDQRNPNIVIID